MTEQKARTTAKTDTLRQTELPPVGANDFDKNADAGVEHLARNSNNKKRQHGSTIEKKLLRKKRLLCLLVRMLNLCKEVAIMLLVALTYAAFTNDPPKITKSPPAYPFFPKDSVVRDFYRGELRSAIESSRVSDIAFVMFYAPWDAESQIVRHEFELTARYMQNEVFFAAVNCWHPGSECQMQNTKVYNWPILIAYCSSGRGVQYHGAYAAPHMMRFLKSISRPLLRISNEVEVEKLLTKYDVVIVGHVNASPGSRDYKVLYSTALRFLEREPLQNVAFCVITVPEDYASEEGVSAPFLRLHVWNETLTYSDHDEWKTPALINWIFKVMHQVTLWVSPSGVKSQSLSFYIQPGPALILFTPYNPLLESVDYYDLLHEVALEYNNCDKGDGRAMFYSRLINSQRNVNYIKHKVFLKKCLQEHKAKYPTVVTYTVPKKWLNNSCCLADEKPRGSCSPCDEFKNMEKGLPKECQNSRNSESCVKIYPSDFPRKITQAGAGICVPKDGFVERRENFKTSMLVGDNESFPGNLHLLSRQEKCRLALVAMKYSPATFSKSIKAFESSGGGNGLRETFNVTGLACKSNASLIMIAMDSLKYHSFAERLGLDVQNMKDKTGAIIINEKMETHYIMKETVDDVSLRRFIRNFTAGLLNRALNSSVQSKYVHEYSTAKDCLATERNSGAQFCVPELNGDSFLSAVLHPEKAVIVLYYSKQCSFCQGVSYQYLMVARAFSSVPNVVFARIEGDLNPLPWEYTMENYPTILFFPVKRKAESKAFPRNIPITVKNLITFVLVNLNWELKLQAMWNLCQQSRFESDKRHCMSSLRSETVTQIGQKLRDWRKADARRKPEILYKLQKLRSLHLFFSLRSNDAGEIQNLLQKLHSSVVIRNDGVGEKRKTAVRDEL